MKSLIKPVGIVALLGLVATAGWFAFGQHAPAPDVAVTRLDGQTLNTGALRGKVVFVNFWATTCTTCVKEMPEVVATYRKYADQGFETLAVAMSYDNPAWVRDYKERAGLPFTVAQDLSGKAAEAFGDVRLTPTSYLIDRKGRIVQSFLGEPKWDSLHAQIERLLAEPA
ncbi:TlpA disulfide reductase family protein [Niveibacterium sp. SC-1]|uniref:TlpA family protein disulfide reductase n=1 Tax=Niveibacterium sp. SC-1 TaxID=3135646 RepID=UPI00311D7446